MEGRLAGESNDKDDDDAGSLELISSISMLPGAEGAHLDGNDGTDKVRWARTQPNVFAVSVDWLASCGFQFHRVAEGSMPVHRASKAVTQGEVLQQQSGTLEPPQLKR